MTTLTRSSSTAAAVAVLLSTALAACADRATGPTTPKAEITSTSSSALWEKAVVGETGPGSTYALYMPHDWNGSVVYWAHGIRDAADAVALPTNEGIEPFRDALGAEHYAVAYSSWDENGYAVKDGVERTHQLRGLFAAQFGQPRHSYLAGASLGGLASIKLAEQFPDQYDGVLTVCGAVGGTRRQLEYVGNVRAVFDVFYPGVLPGDAITVPENVDLNTGVIGPVLAAVNANPNGMLAMARIAQTPLPVFGTTPQQQGATLAQSLLTALGYDVRGINDLLARTHGHSPFDNSATTYTSVFPGALGPNEALILGGLNAQVDRFTTTPDAMAFVDQYYEPTGDLRIPVLTLHNRYDPTVPYFHEPALAAKAAAAGASDRLLQRAFTQYGHCTFTGPQLISAFDDLVQWKETGVKPAA